MRKEIINKLSQITPEEKSFLQGEPLNLSIYNHKGLAIMETGVLLRQGELFGIRTHTRFIDFPEHTHEYVEMVYQIIGKTNHIINSNTSLTLRAGQILFLGRGTVHAVRAAGKEDIAVNFILIPAFFDNAAINLDGSKALPVFLKANLKNTKVNTDYLLYDVSENLFIENILENLILGQMENISLKIQQITLELLLEHLSGLSDKLVLQTKEDQEKAIVLKVLSEIEKQVRVNLSEISAEFGIHVSVLSRMIKKYTGCTFSELLQSARFNRAAKLLRDTDLSIADISVATGYENTAFFYRRFKQIYGCTPHEYQLKKQREQNRI